MSGRSSALLLRVAAVTVVGSGLAYFSPLDERLGHLIKRREDEAGRSTLEHTTQCLPETVKTALLHDKDSDPGATGELVFISCTDLWLLRVLREATRKRRGLTTYRLTLEGESPGFEHGLEIQVLKPDSGGMWDWLPSLLWGSAADEQDRGEVQHVSSLSSVDTSLDAARGGDGHVGPPAQCHVVVHLPPLPALYGLSAEGGGAATAQHEGLGELVSWLEQRQHSMRGLTVTGPSPWALQQLARALLTHDTHSKDTHDDEQAAGATEGVQELVLQSVGLVDRGAVFVHVEGASKEMVHWLHTRQQQHTTAPKATQPHRQDIKHSAPAAAVADSDMDLTDGVGAGIGEVAEEKEQQEEEAAATEEAGTKEEETGVALVKPPSMVLWAALLKEGAFGRAEEVGRLLGLGQEEGEVEELMVQREKERLIAALSLHDALAPTSDSGGAEFSAKGMALVDPISGYDALCAVLADKMDVLTGSPLLPTGVALLDEIRAACLYDDGLVHSLVDQQLLQVTAPSSALPPLSDDTHLLTSHGIEVDYAALRRQEEEADAAQEDAHQSDAQLDTPQHGSGRQPSFVIRSLSLPSLRSLPPCMPYPWSLPPLTGDALGLLVSLPMLTKKAFVALTQDPDAHAILRARSELRHVSVQQSYLNADREVLAQEWRALGDARAALEVRRHELRDDDFVGLQLELIRREQGAASRALEMRQRQTRLRQIRAQIKSSATQRDRVLAHWQGVPEAGGAVPPEELVLFEMESGRRGRPVDVPQDTTQEDAEEKKGAGVKRWWRGWWGEK